METKKYITLLGLISLLIALKYKLSSNKPSPFIKIHDCFEIWRIKINLISIHISYVDLASAE